MKHLLITVLCLFILSNTLYSKDLDKVYIAFYTDGIDGLNFKDGRIAIDLWFNILAKDVNSHMSILYYDDINKLIRDFKKHKFEYVTLNPYYYLKNSQYIKNDISEYWTIIKGNKKFNNFIVLTRSDSNIDSLKDLYHKSIAVKDKNYMDLVYLNDELLKLKGKKAKDYVSEIIPLKTYSKAILDTFFKKNDACIVPKYSFELAAELNPILKKKLKIISTSGDIFLPIITFFHKDTKVIMRKKFDQSVSNMSSTQAGQNIFKLFKMQGIYKLDRDIVAQQQKYFDNYISLSKKYGYLQ